MRDRHHLAGPVVLLHPSRGETEDLPTVVNFKTWFRIWFKKQMLREPGKERELMDEVCPWVCYEKPQEVVQFCKEATGTMSCVWISACVSVLCFQLYRHINLLLHLYSSLQWLFWDLTKHSWKNELLAVLNKCEKIYSLSSGSSNEILALMCSATFMINFCIVRRACQALLDRGMLACIKKILIMSSNYFVITLLRLIGQVYVW